MIEAIKIQLKSFGNSQKIELLKIRGGGGGKVLFFAFFGGAAKPTLCLKMASQPEYNLSIEAEFEKLGAAKKLPGGLGNSVPEPKAIIDIDGRSISIEEAINGKQFSNGEGKANLDRVFDWVCEFHKVNATAKSADREFLFDCLGQYQAAFQGEDRQKFLGSTQKFIDRVWSENLKMPLVSQHGDLHFGNIYIENNDLKVVDWANFGRIQFAGYDLNSFLERQDCAPEMKKDYLQKFFDRYSLSKERLSNWFEILNLFQGLEKLSRSDGYFSDKTLGQYFGIEEFLWLS